MNAKTLYPPTLSSTQTPVLSDNFDLDFNITNLNSINEIGGLEYKISNWTNNKEIDRKVISKEAFVQKNNTTYYVPVNAFGKLDVGSLYRIQIRFISDINSATPIYSEWSNIMLIKRIQLEEIRIINNRIKEANITQLYTIETSTNPLMMGTCSFTEQSKEYVDKYKFELYEIKKDPETLQEYSVFLEDSGWQQHNANAKNADEWRFKQILLPSKNEIGTDNTDNNHLYMVKYHITTVNGYTTSAEPYKLQTIEDNSTETLDFFSFIAQTDEENAKVTLFLELLNQEDMENHEDKILGNYIISRFSEQDEYTKREELKYLNINKSIRSQQAIFIDYTIESGIGYKYTIQRENYYGLRTPDKFAKNLNSNSEYIEVNFQHAYLFKNGLQLKLKYNPKISSFKYTTLAQKQDALSGKYPVISRNKQAYYAEIPVGGLISFQAEDSYDFFEYKYKNENNLNLTGFYYKDELVIPARKFGSDGYRRQTGGEQVPLTDFAQTINSGINTDNIFIEKKYRDKVLEFLNKEEVFLYKSPTEGNFIISLMNVSTTPNQQLSRMISEFSATGYEIAENTLENMIKYNIWDKGEKKPFEDIAERLPGIAQASGFFTQNQNVLEYIKEQVRINIKDSNEFVGSYVFDCFTSITIEAFPRKDLWQEYCVKKIQLEEAFIKGEDTEQLEKDLDIIMQQMEYFKQVPYYDNLIISINNGKEFLISEGQTLTLSQLQLADVSNITVKSSHLNSIKNQGTPLIINYTYRLKLTEETEYGIIDRKEGAFLFGQMAGIFENKDIMLNNFNPYYELYQVPRVYKDTNVNNIPNYTNNFILDNTNMKLYKSLDIYELISQECKQQIEQWYGSMPYETLYEEVLDTGDKLIHKAWTNKTASSIEEQLCYLSQIDMVHIEAAPGTMMTFIYDTNFNNTQSLIEKKVVVGETGVYKVKLEDNLYNIKFDRPTYAIINYSATTIQVHKVYEIKKSEKGEEE